MGKAAKANSKKSAPKSAVPPPQQPVEESLFQVDVVGDSKTRRSLLSTLDSDAITSRVRRGTTLKKPLTSDLILTQASRSTLAKALPSRFDPTVAVNRKAKVDRKTKEKLLAIVGRNGKGEGLWGVKGPEGVGEVTEAVKKAGQYDVWNAVAESSNSAKLAGEDASLAKFLDHVTTTVAVPAKPPTNIHKHALLAPSLLPPSVPLPHPGQSYNPSHSDHQSLLRHAHDHYSAVVEREERGAEIKDALDDARKSVARRETWELYEDEVGAGEVSDEDAEEGAEEEGSALPAKKPSKRKTQAQRNRSQRHAAEMLALERRRALAKRTHSVVTAPSVLATLSENEQTALTSKALQLRLQKQRLQQKGLSHYRSGPSKVPDAAVAYQTGDELSDGLRTLKPEGNLWREWIEGGMRRGKVAVERGYEGRKGGKLGGGGTKGSKTKIKEKRTWKFGLY